MIRKIRRRSAGYIEYFNGEKREYPAPLISFSPFLELALPVAESHIRKLYNGDGARVLDGKSPSQHKFYNERIPRDMHALGVPQILSVQELAGFVKISGTVDDIPLQMVIPKEQFHTIPLNFPDVFFGDFNLDVQGFIIGSDLTEGSVPDGIKNIRYDDLDIDTGVRAIPGYFDPGGKLRRKIAEDRSEVVNRFFGCRVSSDSSINYCIVDAINNQLSLAVIPTNYRFTPSKDFDIPDNFFCSKIDIPYIRMLLGECVIDLSRKTEFLCGRFLLPTDTGAIDLVSEMGRLTPLVMTGYSELQAPAWLEQLYKPGVFEKNTVMDFSKLNHQARQGSGLFSSTRVAYQLNKNGMQLSVIDKNIGALTDGSGRPEQESIKQSFYASQDISEFPDGIYKVKWGLSDDDDALFYFGLAFESIAKNLFGSVEDAQLKVTVEPSRVEGIVSNDGISVIKYCGRCFITNIPYHTLNASGGVIIPYIFGLNVPRAQGDVALGGVNVEQSLENAKTIKALSETVGLLQDQLNNELQNMRNNLTDEFAMRVDNSVQPINMAMTNLSDSLQAFKTAQGNISHDLSSGIENVLTGIETVKDELSTVRGLVGSKRDGFIQSMLKKFFIEEGTLELRMTYFKQWVNSPLVSMNGPSYKGLIRPHIGAISTHDQLKFAGSALLTAAGNVYQLLRIRRFAWNNDIDNHVLTKLEYIYGSDVELSQYEDYDFIATIPVLVDDVTHNLKIGVNKQGDVLIYDESLQSLDVRDRLALYHVFVNPFTSFEIQDSLPFIRDAAEIQIQLLRDGSVKGRSTLIHLLTELSLRNTSLFSTESGYSFVNMQNLLRYGTDKIETPSWISFLDWEANSCEICSIPSHLLSLSVSAKGDRQSVRL